MYETLLGGQLLQTLGYGFHFCFLARLKKNGRNTHLIFELRIVKRFLGPRIGGVAKITMTWYVLKQTLIAPTMGIVESLQPTMMAMKRMTIPKAGALTPKTAGSLKIATTHVRYYPLAKARIADVVNILHFTRLANGMKMRV